MTNKRKTLVVLVAQAFASSALLAVSSVSVAQQPPAQAAPVERVEITGTNIRRAETETASPVLIITKDDIEKSGKATVGEYLQSLAVDNQGSVPMSFGNGFAPGAMGISLRGLGAGSTLVLLNGRRIAPYGLADDGQKVFTDVSVIPMEAVDRIEILKDGASAIYGSDAIAGVVNIILRREFKGTTALVSYGMSQYNDGNTVRAAVTSGFGDLAAQGWNVYFNLEALKADQIFDRDRDRDWIGKGDIRPWGYSRAGSAQFLAGAITGGGTAAGSSPTGAVEQGPPGSLFVSLPGCARYSPNTPQTGGGGGCLWDTAQFRTLSPDNQTINLFARGTWNIRPNMQGYAEAGYNHKEFAFEQNPSGVSGSWGYPGGPVNATSGPGAVVLGPAHPDNPFAGQSVRLRYSAWDVGPRKTDSTNDFTRFLVGLKGTAWGWDYDTGLLHSETNLTQNRTGFIRYSVLKDYLTGSNATGLNPSLSYYRIGVNSGLNSPGVYSAISPTISSEAKSEVNIADIKASRDLMRLPGGPLALALGAEYRQESTKLTPTTYTDQGDIIGLGYSAYDAKRNIGAGYAEVLAPVLKSVELSAALRHDSYSNNGGDSTTPKVGAKWTPIRTLAVRATYAEGFRAPNAAETNGSVAAFTSVRDPVRCPGGVPAAGATAADCNQSVAILAGGSGGTPLQPEKSKSATGGVIWDPLPDTSIGFDAWVIVRNNEINQMTATQAVNGGGTVTRDSTNNLPGVPNSGTLLAVQVPYLNSNRTDVKGYDVDFRQRFRLGNMGALLFDAHWVHLTSFLRHETDGTSFEFAGTHGNCDVTNCIGTPKDRVNASLSWDVGAWRWTAIYNYRGPIQNRLSEGDVCANSFADGSEAPANCKLPAFYTVDLSFRWKAWRELELFGSVQNLFDKVAPLDPLTYGAISYNPLDVSGAIGRFYTVGAKYRF